MHKSRLRSCSFVSTVGRARGDESAQASPGETSGMGMGEKVSSWNMYGEGPVATALPGDRGNNDPNRAFRWVSTRRE